MKLSSGLLMVSAIALGACSATGSEPYSSNGSDAGAADTEAVQDTGSDTGSMIEQDVVQSDSSGECTELIDVVFVLDVSSSMGFVLDKLTSEIDKVVTSAGALAPDPHFGLIAFADNYALDATGPLESGHVHTGAATLKVAFQNYKNVYTANNRNPGDGPNGPTTQNPICEENANDSLYAAANDFPWRNQATRVVILVTDDTFLDRPDNYGDRDGDGKTNKTDYPKEGNYPALRTMVETVAALKAKKIRVFSFTRLLPPGQFDLAKCGTGRRLAWTAISDGWSTPYGGVAPIPTSTGGKNFDVELVRKGTLSLSETTSNVVVESHCNPIY